MAEFFSSWINLVVFVPTFGAIVLALLPKLHDNTIRSITLFFTVAVTALVFITLLPGFSIEDASMQSTLSMRWIPSFDIHYFVGMDGISFPLVMLTAVITMLSMLASWSVKKNVKAYCILFLLLETGMLGVFMALDFFLFYVFWEVMLLPMYFLIGVWGGPRKEYAALKFFLYTLVGSVFMLIAILMLYFNSDLSKLTPQQLVDSRIVDVTDGSNAEAAANSYLANADNSKNTFNMLALAEMGRTTECFNDPMLQNVSIFGWQIFKGWTLQHFAFTLLFLGFIIKVPSVPVHTWLPDAHVEAPTPISMILAGVLLKMGGYGIIRICYPMCPQAGFDFAWFVCAIGVVSMVYGAFAALAQRDFKRLVAYSSVSHMGYVVLGLGVWTAAAGPITAAQLGEGWSSYWNMGVQGAMFQMIAHGISSAGMFFCVGVIYDRVHHRNLDQFGALYGKMPVYTCLATGLFFAGLGLPGLCGFIGEVLVVLSVWNFSKALAVISAFVVILTAGYILWAIQRVYLGAEYKGPHEEDITPINLRELCVAVPLFVMAIIFGVFPNLLLRFMDKTVDRQIEQLAEWTDEHAKPVTEQGAPAAAQHTAPHPTGSQQQAFLPVSNLPQAIAATHSPQIPGAANEVNN